MAATNRDLEEQVRAGRFRSDLYHRLGQFQLKVPPLRSRPEDIVGLAEHLLKQHKPEMRFSDDALHALLAYSWPGNVRELKNVVLQAATLADDAEIRVADLPPEIGGAPRVEDEVPTRDLAEIERQTIVKVLASTSGHRARRRNSFPPHPQPQAQAVQDQRRTPQLESAGPAGRRTTELLPRRAGCAGGHPHQVG